MANAMGSAIATQTTPSKAKTTRAPAAMVTLARAIMIDCPAGRE